VPDARQQTPDLTRWLRFRDPARERAFLSQYAERSRPAFRRTYVNSVIVWLAFCAWDAVVMPDHVRRLWVMRMMFALPSTAIAIALSYSGSSTFARHWQWVGTAVWSILCVGVALAQIAVPASIPWVPIALLGMILIVHAAAMLRFLYAMPVGIIAIVAYLLVCQWVSPGPRAIVGYMAWLVFANVIGLLISHSFELFRRRDWWRTLLLQREKARSEALLYNVLPPSIAERLKRNENPIADRHEQVTVLFADIVNFTVLSERLPPERVVAILNRLFSAFDRLAIEHGLEKIKTVGDAYMVVGGVPDQLADHAHAVARMALAMQEIIHAFQEASLALRIGIHSGPAVAGVIGKQKFTYDLWGDTVNTASRMESHGVAGEIQVSEATCALLTLNPSGDFLLEPRGTIEIKGKAPMQTYFLKAARL
jgi:adenylate cyclase